MLEANRPPLGADSPRIQADTAARTRCCWPPSSSPLRPPALRLRMTRQTDLLPPPPPDNKWNPAALQVPWQQDTGLPPGGGRGVVCSNFHSPYLLLVFSPYYRFIHGSLIILDNIKCVADRVAKTCIFHMTNSPLRLSREWTCPYCYVNIE